MPQYIPEIGDEAWGPSEVPQQSQSLRAAMQILGQGHPAGSIDPARQPQFNPAQGPPVQDETDLSRTFEPSPMQRPWQMTEMSAVPQPGYQPPPPEQAMPPFAPRPDVDPWTQDPELLRQYAALDRPEILGALDAGRNPQSADQGATRGEMMARAYGGSDMPELGPEPALEPPSYGSVIGGQRVGHAEGAVAMTLEGPTTDYTMLRQTMLRR